MSWVSLIAIAVALAMDAFAVAIVSGLTLNRLTGRHIFRLSFHFGLFQFLMPIIGWLTGVGIAKYMAAYDHWIAFALLSFIGGKMIFESFQADETKRTASDPTTGWSLVLLSVATSIDALAVGLSLAMLGSSIIFQAIVIGIVAALFTIAGMLLGRRIGALWGKRVEVFGGIILCAIGIKIVIEHTFG